MTLGLTHGSNAVYLDQAYMGNRVLNPLHQHLNPFTTIHIVTSPSYAIVSYTSIPGFTFSTPGPDDTDTQRLPQRSFFPSSQVILRCPLETSLLGFRP